MKMKEFYQEHKKDIANFAWVMAGAVAGIICTVSAMYSRGVFVVDDNLKTVLIDAQKEFGAGNITIFTSKCADGLKADKLGELGNSITTCGGHDNIFKYFVAIGPDKK